MKAIEKQMSDKDFWNAKAASFPRYSQGEDTYEARMLAAARAMGAVFRNRTVLDVGCGTGMYTLRIAREARKVFALDVSENMLDILRKDAKSLGLHNIEYILSGWQEYARLPACDTVFCSMSAAVRNASDRTKLLQCRGATVVYIDFAWRSPSDVMGTLYRHYDITPKNFNDSRMMREWLDARGLAFASQKMEDKWDVAWEIEKLVDACVLTLLRHGLNADKKLIASQLEPFKRDDGKYHEVTEFSAEILLWKNPDGE